MHDASNGLYGTTHGVEYHEYADVLDKGGLAGDVTWHAGLTIGAKRTGLRPMYGTARSGPECITSADGANTPGHVFEAEIETNNPKCHTGRRQL